MSDSLQHCMHGCHSMPSCLGLSFTSVDGRPHMYLTALQDQLSQEASVMRKYRHRNILPLFCSFVHGQHLWLVMPWISGGTLAEIVQARCAPRQLPYPMNH